MQEIMFEIIISILLIICYIVASIIIYQLRKTIRCYREENMHLRRRLDEEENKHLELKIPKLSNPILSNHILEEHNATEVLYSIDYERLCESGNEKIIKSHLANTITEKLLEDDVFRFVVEQNILDNEVAITAILKVLKEK